VIRLARHLWRLVRAPFALLGPGAARSGRSVYRRTWLLLTFSVVISNVVGAVIVFVFAVWVIPGKVEDPGRVVLANLAAFALYVSIAVVAGAVLGTTALRSVRDFLTEEREANRREQRVVVRGPFRVGFVAFGLWAVAVPLFATLNAAYDLQLVAPVALTVFLGGPTSPGHRTPARKWRRPRSASSHRHPQAGFPHAQASPSIGARRSIRGITLAAKHSIWRRSSPSGQSSTHRDRASRSTSP
jgi:hypothetical protein